jgi:hypothetical protein
MSGKLTQSGEETQELTGQARSEQAGRPRSQYRRPNYRRYELQRTGDLSILILAERLERLAGNVPLRTET